ncbi:MAG: ATP-dependent DNA ligase, partial [Rhodococcus sp. (in: high G+C Gram-positive bacteria)]|uniref:ATP-dependent DNA ligase n=1 Tax=Rhodococcus sp. TaxID=1831 RepID=UPI003BAF08A5
MATAGTRQVTIDGHRLSLGNLDKVLYPETGTTKGEVIDYYIRIAPAMLPHIVDRAATRKRWPNGVDSEPFFEKNLAASAPAWLERRALDHSDRSVTYPVLNSVAALAWAGQQASLEVHVPQWRFENSHRGSATRIVFDLDPGPGVGLPECAEVARAVRDLVANLGWEAYPVTSGSKGIHVYVPLDRRLQGSGVSTVAKQVATGLEKLLPDLVTSTMAKAARGGKVFVDWSQNNPSKTTIAPYSLRGRPQPYVAAPRSWDELGDPDLAQLRFDEVLARWEADGDLLAGLDPEPEDSALAEYLRKRDPGRTPEPMPSVPPEHPGDGNSFVIQEHHARRLHYDLRLERDGVLVSWAVPKNVPTSTGENRLAVHTEDHPLEYATFSGTIPKGEYGGGTMNIWDTGTYDTEKWREDEVIVRLQGEKVEGRFALIRTKGDQWLMHLMKDQDPAGSRTSELPRGLAPMLATPGTLDGLDANEWAFEGKWDGVRVIAEISDGQLRLRSRAGNDKTKDYPGLAWLEDALGDHEVVLDGEVVAYDSNGITDFGLLQQGDEPHFLAFDVLYLDGVSLLRKKYTDRRRVLEALAAKVDDLVVPPQLQGSAEEALAESRRKGWEGVVAKRRDSVYLPGKRGSSWI